MRPGAAEARHRVLLGVEEAAEALGQRRQPGQPCVHHTQAAGATDRQQCLESRLVDNLVL